MKKTLIGISLALASVAAVYAQANDTTAVTTTATPTSTPTHYASADNQAGKFGVGVILGEPIGASLKYWLNDTLAIDGAIGASLNNDDNDDNSDFYMHSDLLWHNFDLLPVAKGRLPVYFGVGGLVRFRDDEDNQVGIRIPLGISYILDNAPVDIFAEIGPAIDVAPDVRGELTGGIGVRFWF